MIRRLVLIPLFVFILLELGVRTLGRDAYRRAENHFNSLRYESSILSRYLLPESPQRVTTEKGIVYEISERGYRGKSFSVEKPKGVTRVMIYGGSSVFDFEANEGEDWPTRLDQLLKTKDSKIEVINAGVPGHATFDCVGRLWGADHRAAPDYVILYALWNDLKYFNVDPPIGRYYHAYQPDLRTHFHNFLDRLFGTYSHFYLLTRQRGLEAWFGRLPEGSASRQTSSSPDAERLRRGLHQYQLNVALFIKAAREIGAIPILMTEAHLAVAGSSPADRERVAYSLVGLNHETLVGLYEQAERGLRKLAHREKVPLWDAAKELSGQREYFSDHVHLSPAGSAALAAYVSRRYSSRPTR